jgi:hypothetical protein
MDKIIAFDQSLSLDDFKLADRNNARMASTTSSGSPERLKIKTAKRQEVVIADSTAPRRHRAVLRSSGPYSVRRQYIALQRNVSTGVGHKVLEDLHAKPAGLIGSITHTSGFRAAAVTSRSVLASIGIDAEQNDRLPDGVEGSITVPGEPQMLSGLSAHVRQRTGAGCCSARRNRFTRLGTR